MATFAHILRTAVEYSLVPFDALPPFWGLTLFSIITGVIMLWIVGKLTPQARIEKARDQVASTIYETRLFLDSPGRIVSSQGRMLAWLAAYLGYLMPAFIVLSFPLGLLYFHLDVRYGQDPIPVETPVIIRVDLAANGDGNAITTEGSRHLAVTAPPLYRQADDRVYLRIQVQEPGAHELTIRSGEHVITKKISADPNALEIHPDRTSGLGMWISYGDEAPLDSAQGISAITIIHPPKPQSWLGIDMPWWVYWLIVSTIFALALRRPMGVVL